MMNVKICCHCHFLKEAYFNRNFKCLPQHFWEYRIGIHFQWIKNNTVYYFIKTRSDLICLGYSNTTLYKVSVYYLLNIQKKKKKAKQYNKNKKLTLASLLNVCQYFMPLWKLSASDYGCRDHLDLLTITSSSLWWCNHY